MLLNAVPSSDASDDAAVPLPDEPLSHPKTEPQQTQGSKVKSTAAGSMDAPTKPGAKAAPGGKGGTERCAGGAASKRKTKGAKAHDPLEPAYPGSVSPLALYEDAGTSSTCEAEGKNALRKRLVARKGDHNQLAPLDAYVSPYKAKRSTAQSLVRTLR